MDIREMRTALGDTQSGFAARYHIPFRTIQNWESGVRRPPEYIRELLAQRVREDLVNRRTVTLPEYDPRKEDLPARGDFIGAVPWLKAVRDRIGEDVVFALDEALMCQDLFGGRSDEYVVWIYGDRSAERFNGIAVLGRRVSPFSVLEKDGLRFTDLNRTISDALANESLLDMQGVTEALSKYYYSHDESFNGLLIPPQYQERFDTLVHEAIDYYRD